MTNSAASELFLDIEHPEQTSKCSYWPKLAGASMALACVETSSKHRGLTIVVTASTREAQQLQREIKYFAATSSIAIYHFPDWETLPYDYFSPHESIISERIKTLYNLSQGANGLLILPIQTLAQRIAPMSYLQQECFIAKQGIPFDSQQVRQNMIAAGYRLVPEVMEHGEFAIRGSIFDIFPMGSQQPFRLDLFDNEIDSIRKFDPETQRSFEPIESITILPAKEFPFTEDAIRLFRQQWRELFQGKPTDCPVYEDISQQICPPGIEYYLPLFFKTTATLFDYLPASTLFIKQGQLHKQYQQFWQELETRHQQYSHDRTRPLLAPASLFLRTDELFRQFNQYRQIDTSNNPTTLTTEVPKLIIQHKATDPLAALRDFISETCYRILISAESTGRRETLRELLQSHQLKPTAVETWSDFSNSNTEFAIGVSQLEQGFISDKNKLAVITENELFEYHVARTRQRTNRVDSSLVIKNLAELKLGDAVVHIDHGVGRYLGLQILAVGGRTNEFVTLGYADEAKLYVPITSLQLISRYSGADKETAPLHSLGSNQWETAKRKAAEKIRDVAAELLDIYARREAKQGFCFNLTETDYSQFANEFPFEETPDQAQAINQVITDMTTSKLMDRLVCGDVGFGKTEVAMRAAFIAANNQKQVAVLVPTTLLAEQHYQNFKDRFANWPITIACLSRFQSKQEQESTVTKLKQGKIDIVIGTHKIIQQRIQFHDLSLLIIDEEHRFGVKQKDVLKSFRSEIDVLALTATPIPRTLNLSLSGVRDLSIIATPPAKRLAIKTFTFERNREVIREAILREISRGGQVYFVHNRVESITNIADELTELVPTARIAVAHGQMPERQLERVMSDFYHVRFNVLVCSTIIENGIDVATANTIIIDRADRFGLAQLHQIRGRVGRSHHQAYAYLLVPAKKFITADGQKRLEAFAALSDLGVGFTLATHDLEIRGAGEFLGEEQSGHIQSIGFSLYIEMLDATVKALQTGNTPAFDKPLQHGVEIDCGIATLIPDTFLNDVQLRLLLYKRIANATTIRALDELQIEMIDRFGLLPDATKNLFQITALKLKAEQLGISKIELSAQGGIIAFTTNTTVQPQTIIQLIQQQPTVFRFDGADRLRINLTKPADERIAYLDSILNSLASNLESFATLR